MAVRLQVTTKLTAVLISTEVRGLDKLQLDNI